MKPNKRCSVTHIILRILVLGGLLIFIASVNLWAEQKTAAGPYAYLFPESLKKLAEHLQREGVEVNELREDIELDVEAYGQAC